jgi:hypothetical protein
MSYLDIPRFHFSGTFRSDPSTVNNTISNYTAVTTPLWNPNGKAWFGLENCTVTSAVDAAGNAANTDPVVGGKLESTNLPSFGRLVDIDPAFQTASQIWGLEFKAGLKSGAGDFTGKLQPVNFRDLWQSRAPGGFAGGFGAVYQSALIETKFTNIDSSPVLKALSKEAAISIKFAVYAYDAMPGSPTFTTGKIVGTIGPAGRADGEPAIIDLGVHFLHARRVPDESSGAFGSAPFKLNPGKKKLTIDLGNCIPEKSPGGDRKDLGKVEAVIVLPGGAAPVVLGELDYTKAHYERTAGIEDLRITDAQVKQLEKNPLGITSKKMLIISERPKGLYLDVTEMVFRLSPGDSANLGFVATEFGKPKGNLKVFLRLLKGTPPAALTFPADTTTNSSGLATAQVDAGDPGNPRGPLDGQLYVIGFFSGPPAASTLEGNVIIKVYDKFTAPKSPVYADVKPILDQYSKIYPIMKPFADLSDLGIIKTRKDAILKTLQYPMEDPRYMPVTRDLSPAKSKVLVDWLNLGCP